MKSDKNLKMTVTIVCAWSDSGRRVSTTPLESNSNAVGYRHLGYPWWYGGQRTGWYGISVTVNPLKRSCTAGSVREWGRILHYVHGLVWLISDNGWKSQTRLVISTRPSGNLRSLRANLLGLRANLRATRMWHQLVISNPFCRACTGTQGLPCPVLFRSMSASMLA